MSETPELWLSIFSLAVSVAVFVFNVRTMRRLRGEMRRLHKGK